MENIKIIKIMRMRRRKKERNLKIYKRSIIKIKN